MRDGRTEMHHFKNILKTNIINNKSNVRYWSVHMESIAISTSNPSSKIAKVTIFLAFNVAPDITIVIKVKDLSLKVDGNM